MRKPNPCFNCPNRTCGCHSTCEAGIAWEKENHIEREKAHKKKNEYYEAVNYYICTKNKLAKA